ncbi:unnamed protein product [Allacma fusca]|uniref:Uncharacterized protein n=1 Tax=Allacma fusca TaxID=39272 RepID=A0A8J2NUP1_9HEXA|nr:unnamed protein product [Allacma fusca]
MPKGITVCGCLRKNKTNVNCFENISVLLADKTDFVIKRIPDVAIPTFIILSGAIVLFYVSIGTRLLIYEVVDKQPSSRAFLYSSSFIKSKVHFTLDENTLGTCISKEQVAYNILDDRDINVFEIVINGDGLSCKVIGDDQSEVVTLMEWEPYWTESDTNAVNPNDLPPSASYNLKFVADLEPDKKLLVIVSSFCVQYSQRQINAKKCTKKSALIMSVILLLFLASMASFLYKYVFEDDDTGKL